MSAASPEGDAFSPSQITHALMLSYLYPLFRGPDGNVDPMMARSAAIETLKTFRIRDTWELFTCTQIMSFGLAAMGSIGLSMTGGMSPGMVVRCRGNANGLHRASQQSRRTLDEYRAASEAQLARDAALADVPELAVAQAEAAAQIAESERLLAAIRAQPLVRDEEDAAYKAPQTAPSAGAHAQARSTTETPASAEAAALRTAPAEPAASQPTPVATARQSTPAAKARQPAPLPPGARVAAPLPSASHPAPAYPQADMPVAAAPFCNGYRAAALSSAAPYPAAPATMPNSGALPPMPQAGPGVTELQHQRMWANSMLTVARELSADLPNVSPEERRLNSIRISALTKVANDLLKGRKPTSLPPLHVPRFPQV